MWYAFVVVLSGTPLSVTIILELVIWIMLSLLIMFYFFLPDTFQGPPRQGE